MNYVNEFDLYSYIYISNFFNLIFSKNGLNIEKHYEKELIKDNKNNKIKGVNIYASQSDSMEEDILQIFLDKINKIPFYQNILFSNKETSYEKMQICFNKPILCKFNALFVVYKIIKKLTVYKQYEIKELQNIIKITHQIMNLNILLTNDLYKKIRKIKKYKF